MCEGIQGYERVYKGIQGYTRVYRGIRRCTWVYKGFQGYKYKATRVYKGMKGYTRVYKGIDGGINRGIQGCCLVVGASDFRSDSRRI